MGTRAAVGADSPASIQAAGISKCELRGSPKQVAWASDIRTQVMDVLVSGLAVFNAKFSDAPRHQSIHDAVQRLVQRLALQSDAAWWIERRSAAQAERFSCVLVDLTFRETSAASILNQDAEEFAKIVDRIASNSSS